MSGFEPNSTYDNRAFEPSHDISLNAYIAQTFMWMAAGLLVTFGAALALAQSGLVFQLFRNGGSFVMILALVAQLAVVFFLTLRISKLSVGAARVCFFIYAALTGVNFSLYFIVYDLDILIYAFGLTGLFFGGMAFLTLKMNLDVSNIGRYLMSGLIFMVVVGLIGAIARIGWINILTAWVGLAVFIGYTAYDTQMIRRQYETYRGDAIGLKKASIFSALQLYLDFINLLLSIIRILAGNRSRD